MSQDYTTKFQDNEDLDSIPTIQLSSDHEIHLADAIVALEKVDHTEHSKLKPKNSEGCMEKGFRVPVTDVEPVTNSQATTYWAPLDYSVKQNRAALLSATVNKENRIDKVGLCLSNNRNDHCFHLTISSILPGGLFSQSPFHVGDQLISINNISCQDMKASVALQLLRNITGTLTLVVENPLGDPQLVETMVNKPRKKGKTGLSIISNGYSQASVYDIKPRSIFATSLLNRYDLILSINGISCQYLDSREAASIVANADSCLTIIAKRRSESAVVLAVGQ